VLSKLKKVVEVLFRLYEQACFDDDLVNGTGICPAEIKTPTGSC